MAVDGAKFELYKFRKSLGESKNELSMLLFSKFEDIDKNYPKDINDDKTITSSPEKSLKLLCSVNNLLAECRIFAHHFNQLNKNIFRFNLLTMWWFVRRKRRKLDEILKDIQEVKPEEKESSSHPRKLLQTTRTNGFDKTANEIEKVLLRQGGKDFTAYGITGMAGTGKTALAQQVFDSDQIRDKFRRRIWVSLSDREDSHSQVQSEKVVSLIRIMKCILKELNDDPDDVLKGTEHTDFFEVFVKVQNRLSEHKCLIVIDDIWQEKELYKSVCHGMAKDKEFRPIGGAIIITSRQEDLVKRMVSENGFTTRLDHKNKSLQEDCWKIFEEAVKKEETTIDIEKIKYDINYKIQGLPLAAETLAQIIPKKYEGKGAID